MANKPHAFMNHGRWLYRCPRCDVAIEADRDICPRCWPGVKAKAFQPIEGTKLMRRIPDPEMIAQTRAQAEASGELYKPVFPADKSKIEQILRCREIRHMNWQPGESLSQLTKENCEHGVRVPCGMEDAHGLQ